MEKANEGDNKMKSVLGCCLWIVCLLNIWGCANTQPTFFITSADSATFVLGTLTTNGSLNPPNHIKFTWGVIQSLSAAILLWSGGLKGLQTGAILAAFPFVFVIIILIISLLKSFQEEVRT